MRISILMEFLMSDDTDYDYEGYASWAVDLVEQWRKDSNSIAIEPID